VTDPVLQTFALGAQWPTLDPFLFCAHHDDAYPAGDERGAPAVPIDDRDLGMDFSGAEGWSMYHGLTVPGFPGHPHRGFETVTYVRTGLIDHADSLGAAARFGRGDVQWVTAGAGIVHSEMFPLLERKRPNPLELFQIWLNLPAEDKLVEPFFTMFWDGAIPRLKDDGVEVTVIAGRLGNTSGPTPPPRSWAARPDADVAIWHVRLEPGASWTLPPAAGGGSTSRALYVFEGAADLAAAGTGLVLDAAHAVPMIAGPDGLEALLLQGRPIGQPVAQYGPFVMNTKAEIEQAMRDYQRTHFGGWPWPDEAPTHGREPGRFARYPDGNEERP
jgi:redox-sensitive bicupin YhaK (pirin superfamily)